MTEIPNTPPPPVDLDADSERRFGGLRRLHGERDYQHLRAARFAVVGLGGVGSWVVEALARMGVARLVLIDLDHVAESNINRQVQALGSTLGMAKSEALRQRVADIHPGCEVITIEEFVDEENWPALLGDVEIDGIVDACDQVRAKAQLAAWARRLKLPHLCVGAAGGKQRPQDVEVLDLAETTHDPLLASLRQRLRKLHGLPKQGPMTVRCVFSREPVRRPDESCDMDGSLNCHGYGSSVAVTAGFGMVAAAELVTQYLKALARREKSAL
ncbi:tRNA A37 threonylcarbamoyladenosine dehydratase [Roseateles sp. YR242]|uniref:tRNA threonylcarbamoyladenosine dehydratase n=1 Tax=Roseateles sp. YR242 TaxID=1855305 RepID=UPI0008B43E1A|nr:tRNA threonylcarbamoyladenosine dehydratase [Roseateles sp. YR242]SEK33291.1 tRNA A37 threonylcarbamoyladenosine dehydratase [Roseateles sp. YR242]